MEIEMLKPVVLASKRNFDFPTICLIFTEGRINDSYYESSI
jgi:hypothetical protein